MKLDPALVRKVLEMTGEIPAVTVKKVSEKEFQAEVVAYAKRQGWTVFHVFDSRKSQAGFPDLVFSRGPGFAVRLVVAELKVGKCKPTPTQYAWLASFEHMSIPTYWWTPGSWPIIVKILGESK